MVVFMADIHKANIDPGIQIITLGSLGILITTFIKSYDINIDTSLFSLSAFCLILAGIIVVYRETVVKRHSLRSYQRRIKKDISFSEFHSRGFSGFLNIISNTLFDFGMILLLFGVGKLLITEFEQSTFIMNNLWIIAIVIAVTFIFNLFYRREFGRENL